MTTKTKIKKSSSDSLKDKYLILSLESLPLSVVIFTPSKILFANLAALKTFKAEKEFKKNITAHSIFEFVLPEYHKRIKENNKKILSGELFEPFVLKIKNAKNQIIDLEVKSNLIFFEGKKAIQTVFTDITREKTYQIELEQKWNNYKNLLDTSPIGIFIHKGECIYCNKTAANILEIKNPESLIGKNLIKFLVPEQRQRALDRMALAIKGEELTDLAYKAKTIKGNIIDIELKTVPIIFNGKVCVQTTVSNLSAEKKLTQEILRAEIAEETNKKLTKEIKHRHQIQHEFITHTTKYEAVFESSSHLIWTIDKDFRATSFNRNFIQTFKMNYKSIPVLNKQLHLLIPKLRQKEYKEYWYTKYKSVLEGKFLKVDRKSTTIGGKVYYMEIAFNPIRDRNDEITEIACLANDVTESNLNEQRIKESLQEKEILLKELHHRVKNNMQVISSLLNLQSSYVSDEYALNLLKESQNRIKAMAFIHESLYQTKNFQKIDFSEYIGTLTKNLTYTYGANSQKIKLKLMLESVFLNIHDSIPCGLIINEIISNSLKYAFPDDRDGIIFVTLKKIKNKIKIEVGDNGVGIPKGIDIKNTKTLGLQLVNTLAEQIDAKIISTVSNGTKFNIEFNIYE